MGGQNRRLVKEWAGPRRLALWEGTSERGGAQSSSREVWRLRFKCDWWRRPRLRAEKSPCDSLSFERGHHGPPG